MASVDDLKVKPGDKVVGVPFGIIWKSWLGECQGR